MDNVLLTSHLAWYTVEADERLAKECMARVIEVLEGRRPRNIKNAEALGLA
jgi:phosphoglycerate dehydrogenase-like enzyme